MIEKELMPGSTSCVQTDRTGELPRLCLNGILVKLCLLISSLIISALVLEFMVFRYVLIASDAPQSDFVNGVIKLKPNQEGVSRFRNEYRARYRVNSEGWNSKYEHYSINKSQAKLRLTVIGDSFVQARQVDFDKSLAERLEQKLGSDRYEVYRFGVSAAPLSQYLQVFRTEVVNYSPDLAIFVLIHNDFEESYNFELGRYTTSFLRLKLESGRVEEIAPRKYERPWYSWIRGSATYRYLVDRQHLNIQSVKNFVNYYRFKTEFQANIDVSNVGDRARFDELATDYVFRRIKEIAESRSIRLLMVMDGDRRSIYKGVPSDRLYARGALMLNKMAQRLAKKYNIAFIDLHPVFEENYRLNKKSFDFENDTHWNEYGHEIAARAIYQHLRDDIEN